MIISKLFLLNIYYTVCRTYSNFSDSTAIPETQPPSPCDDVDESTADVDESTPDVEESNLDASDSLLMDSQAR